ncbi:MAG: PAS domain S-box protein [Desulfobacteraceae bacterium]|nr:PAS domain S-box protein [Desulfobacteraceae bacterium]
MPEKKHDLFRLALETIPDAINLNRLDDGMYLNINDGFTTLTGYTVKEVTGKTSLELGLWKEPEVRRRLVNALKETGYVEGVETEFVCKNGTIKIGLMSARILEIDNEKIILSITKDITYRRQLEKELHCAGHQLQELNAALDTLLQKREQDIQKLVQNIASNFESVLLPIMGQIKNTLSTADQHNLFDVLEKSIQEMMLPFSKKLSDPMTRLTPREIQTAAFIKQGFCNKEIARILKCSIRTVDTHRDNIRKKLGLKHTSINLKSYLMNI